MNVIRYNQVQVFAEETGTSAIPTGGGPAYTGYKMALLNGVQSAQISYPEVNLKQKRLGRSDTTEVVEFYRPSLSLELEWLYCGGKNESLVGFNPFGLMAGGFSSFCRTLTGKPMRDMMIVVDHSGAFGDLNRATGSSSTGVMRIMMMNATPTNYSMSISVNQPMSVGVSFDVDEGVMRTGVNNTGVISYSGLNRGQWVQKYTSLAADGAMGGRTGESIVDTLYLPSGISFYIIPHNYHNGVVSPPVGGQPFGETSPKNLFPNINRNNLNATSVQFDIAIDLQKIEGFGSVYPKHKKVKAPCFGQLTVEVTTNSLDQTLYVKELAHMREILFHMEIQPYKVKGTPGATQGPRSIYIYRGTINRVDTLFSVGEITTHSIIIDFEDPLIQFPLVAPKGFYFVAP